MKKKVPFLIFLFFVLLSILLSTQLKPNKKLNDQLHPINLNRILPLEIPNWREVTADKSNIVNPEVSEVLSSTYDQILTKIYVDGRRIPIMLSIAYGANQIEKDTLHFPEVCYPAQGFYMLQKSAVHLLSTPFGSLYVRQFVAEKPGRIENVSYWAMIGRKNVTDPWHLKAVQIKYGLQGYLPDGLIFRVSSVGPDTEMAFKLQAEFIQSLLASLSPQDRQRLTGLGVN